MFCQACAAPLGPAAPPRKVRKTVTVVFCDVAGSTELGERLQPETTRRVMARYFQSIRGAAERHGGVVEKFIGDAVMTVFGIPRLHDDDALRAARAAQDMRNDLEVLNKELERDHGVTIGIRIGVNTGEVVAGDPASRQQLVTSDAVNVAARLEQAAPSGEVLIGEDTHGLVQDAVTVETVEPIAVKGKAKPVKAFRLIAVSATAPGPARWPDSHMVGRERERDILMRAFRNSAEDRSCHLVSVLGPAGVGKSRLVAELLGEVGGKGSGAAGPVPSLRRGHHLLPHPGDRRAGGRSVGPRPDRRVAGEGRGAAGRRGRWPTRRRTHRSDPRDLVDRGLAGGDVLGRPEAPRIPRPRRTARGGDRRRPVGGAGTPRPDRARRGAVSRCRDPAALPVPPGAPRCSSGLGRREAERHTISLEPLSEEESVELIDNLLGRSGLSEEAGRRIASAAEGNPLFVEKTLSMLIDDGLLRRTDGGWTVTGDLSELSVPPTIHALLAARIDRLPETERAAIERGAVEGKRFHLEAVRDLSGGEARDGIPSALQSLTRKDLIRPDRADFQGQEAFGFRHQLIRDAAYRSIPKDRRAELHERFSKTTCQRRAAGG
jgi:class 3 adenylate cyclase